MQQWVYGCRIFDETFNREFILKNILIIIVIFFVSFRVSAQDCPSVPKIVETTIHKHIQQLRAGEYCSANKIQISENIIVSLYSALSACYSDAVSKPGTCGNHWERYMAVFNHGKLIAQIQIGGDHAFFDNEIKILNNQIEVIGLGMGPDDISRPSLPTTLRFEVSENGIVAKNP